VATERVPGTRSVATGVWVGVGSRDEPDHRQRREPLPRTPAVQGHATRRSARTSRAPSTVAAATSTRSPPRSTRRTTAGCPRVTIGVLHRTARRRAHRPALRDERRARRAPGDPRRDGHGRRLSPTTSRSAASPRRCSRAIRWAATRLATEHVRPSPPTTCAGSSSSTTGRLDGGGGRPGRWSTTRCWPRSTRCFAGVAPAAAGPVRIAPALPGTGAAIDDDSEQVHIVMGGRGVAATIPSARRSTS
jgi:hypothetical protein